MLTAKEKMELRAKANTISRKYTLGKEGLTLTFIDMINKALEAKELIKVSLLKTVDASTREIAFDLASKTHSDIVQIIGRVVVLYRKSNKK